MVASGDVLLDAACSPQVRIAVQAVFPGVLLRLQDIGVLVESDHVALNQACAVVLGLRNQHGAPSIPVIEALRTIAPHIGVFVIEERSASVDQWLPRLAGSGVDDGFALDRPGDENVLRSVLTNRVALPPPELALRELYALWANSPVRVEALYCVRNGYLPRHRFRPHEWLGFKARSLRTKFERAGMPTPLFLTRFGRDLHWRESVARGRRSRVELAALLGFETVEQVGIEQRRVRAKAVRWPPLIALLQ